MKKLFIVFALFLYGFSFAQNEKEEVKKAIETFFTAMYNGDVISLQNTFSESVVFQTITKDGSVKNEDAKKFAEGISGFKKGELDERIKFKTISIDGTLASVWTPYQFYFKGKFSHCGVNNFVLVKQNGSWKIQYIIDTRRKENCK